MRPKRLSKTLRVARKTARLKKGLRGGTVRNMYCVLARNDLSDVAPERNHHGGQRALKGPARRRVW